jgi:antitoxin component YwqK of YwqJK toxin-antitoxin module
MQVNYDDIELDESDRAYLNDEPYTGEVIETTSTGQVVGLTTYYNGVEDGPSAEWYPTGERKAAGTITWGLPTGTHEEWHRNGTLATHSTFDDKGHLLTRRRWDENGTLIEEIDQTP